MADAEVLLTRVDVERCGTLENDLHDVMGALCIPFAYARRMESGVHHDPAVDLDEFTRRYCQSLVAELEVLTFRGISRSGAISLRLEDIYVELKAVAQVSDILDTYGADERRLLAEAWERGEDNDDLRMHLDTLRLERWRTQARAEGSALERRSIENVVADPRQTGLVILGDPGSGKSTLLRHLALRAARLHLEDTAREGQVPAALATATGQPRLPILVPLAAYDGFLRRHEHKHVSLREYLPIYFDKVRNFPGLGPLVAVALEQGRALVLLDGLDEVLDESTRQHVASQVRTLMQQEAQHGNRFVVTSRVMGYHAAPLPPVLPHVTVLDFGIEEIEAFARKWCEACEIGLAGQRTEVVLQRAAHEAQALQDEVRAHPHVLALAANPLLLTMLALLRRQDYKLPEQRIELYRRYVETMLDNSWENARSDGARVEGPVRFDLHLAVEYLMELSLWLHQNRPNGTARRQELLDALVDIGLRLDGTEPAAASSKNRREALSSAERFLREMRHFAGLLGERGQDAYGFFHLTFQEYFVARALARKDAETRWQVIAPNLHRPRWRESILLCAGQLGIVDGRRNEVNDLVRRILRAQSPHEELLHRDLLLANAVASDNVGLDRRLLDELADRLIHLQESYELVVRSESLRGLAQLARLGHEPSLSWLEDKIACPRRPEEVIEAIENVLGADSCARLRRALRAWFIQDADGANLVYEDDEESRRGRTKTEANVEPVARREAMAALGRWAASNAEIRQLLLDRAADANEDESVRQEAVEALGPLAASDQEVRQLLLDRAADAKEDGLVRREAVEALGLLAASDEQARRLLMNEAADAQEHARVRQDAMRALGPLAASDEQVRRLLMNKAEDAQEHERVRVTAAMVLRQLAARDEQVQRLFMNTAADAQEHARVRQAAIRSLRSLVASDEQVRQLSADRAANAKKNKSMRQAAVETLGPLAPSGEQIWQLLMGTAADTQEDGTVRQAAVEVLGSLAASDEQVRRLLMGMVASAQENELVREAAVNALSLLASGDEQVRRLFLDTAKDTIEEVRSTVHSALAPIVHAFPECRLFALEKLDDYTWDVAWHMVAALQSLVESDVYIRKWIISRTADIRLEMRLAVVHALGLLARTDQQVRRLLLDKAVDTKEDVQVRSAAIEALGPVAGNDDQVRRLLLDRVVDTKEEVSLRGAVMGAFGLSAGSDEQVRQLLLDMAADEENEAVQREAIKALEPLVGSDARILRRLLSMAADARENGSAWQAAVEVLGSLVGSDEQVRRRLLDMAVGARDRSLGRRAAVAALGSLAGSDKQVQQLLLDKVEDAKEDRRVRVAAVKALGPLAASDEQVQRLLIDKVEDAKEDTWVRVAAVEALGPLAASDGQVQRLLLGKIGDAKELGWMRAVAVETLVLLDRLVDSRGLSAQWMAF